MKRAFLILILLVGIIFCKNSFSQEVSLSEISDIATNLTQKSYFQQNKLKSGQAVSIAKLDSIVVDGKTIGYFVFYKPEGFAVIPALKELTPHFAFSGQGNYIESPHDGILSFLKTELTLRYKAFLDKKLPSSKILKNKEQWNQSLLKSGNAEDDYQFPPEGSTTTGGLIETTWKQGDPYNKFCPEDPLTKKPCITGCVATAMAQVVNYWGENTGKPTSVSLSTNYTSVQTPKDNLGTRTIVISANSASFSNLTYTLSEDEIAKLNYACGVSVQMDYSSSSSGAPTSSTIAALVNDFGFETAERIIYDSDFHDKLYFDIENGQPCLLSITGDLGGHAIVCDGFIDDGISVKYHMNYGWNGRYAKTGSDFYYEIPDDLPDDTDPDDFTSIKYGVGNILMKEKAIELVEYDNLFVEKEGQVKIEITAPKTGSYYIGVWNGLQKPNGEWQPDNTAQSNNIGSSTISLSASEKHTFEFGYTPIIESQTCTFVLYRESSAGIYYKVDEKEASINAINDNNPPTISQVNYTTDITTDINLVFSEKMDINTITSGNVNLVGSISGAHTFGLKYNDGSTLLSLEPVIDFEINEEVTVTLSNNITDLAGNGLDGDSNGTAGPDYTLSFTTKGGEISLTNGGVNPSPGELSDDFTFSVDYKDELGDNPQSVKIYVEGASNPFEMSSSQNVTRGATYSKLLNFNKTGAFAYYFEAITANGNTLRFPELGGLTVVVNKSVSGWDMVTNEINASPKYMLDAEKITVSVEYVNMSDAQDKTYYNLPYKFEIFAPNGELEDSESGTISECPVGSVLKKTANLSPGNIDGSHQVVFTVYPPQDEDNSNNSKSMPIIIGVDGPTREYYVKSKWREVKMDVSNQTVTYEGHIYKINYIGNGRIEISQDGGSQKDIDTDDFREYNSYTDVLICEYINTVGDDAGYVSFGSSESGVVEYTSTNISGYAGESVYFTGTCNGTTFSTWRPNIYRNDEVDDWYEDVDLFNSNKTAEYEFEIPNNASAGVYEFYMGAELSDEDYFLRKLSITVLQPLPEITSLSKNTICGNEVITVNGKNFGTKQGTVKFTNLVSTQISSWNITEIECVVPLGISNGNLYVVNDGGTSNGYSYGIGDMETPSNVSASDGVYCDKIRVAWDVLTGATSYNVFRGETLIASNISETSYDDIEAESSITSYSVTAVGACGESSKVTDVGSKDVQSEAPSFLIASKGAYCDRVTLSWNAVSNVTSYKVYRGTTLIEGNASQNSFVDMDAPTSETQYSVSSLGSCGESEKTTAFGFRNGEIGAPTNVEASDGTYCDKVLITWSSVAGAESYNVYKDGELIISNLVTTSYDYYEATSQNTEYSVSANGFCGSSSKISDTGRKCIINLPQVSSSLTAQNSLCFQSNTGKIDVNYTISTQNGNIYEHGICWSETGNPSVDSYSKSNGSGAGSYSASISNLEAGHYYVCAYAENEAGIEYSLVEEVNIFEPERIEMINYSITPMSSSITLSDIQLSGGVPPYNIKVVGTPYAASFNQWDAVSDSPLIYNELTPETMYSLQLQVQDANGCTILLDNIELTTTEEVFVPEIDITAPSNGEQWEMGSTQKITWTDNFDDDIVLLLYKGSLIKSFVDSISANIASNGIYYWEIPDDLTEDDNYYIKAVHVADESVSDYSSRFALTKALEPDVEMIMHRISDLSGQTNTDNPGLAKSSFYVGEKVRITFKVLNKGRVILPVGVLNLYDNTNKLIYDTHAIGANNEYAKQIVANDGVAYLSFDWTVAEDVPAGAIHVAASLRDQNNWDLVFDETASGANTKTFGSESILQNQFSILERTLVSIKISGEGSMNENSTSSYSCEATYSNGDTRDVTSFATWSDNSDFAAISSTGVLSANEVETDITVTISAEFEGVIATKEVSVEDAALVSVEIIGSSEVNENTTEAYTFYAQYSNGTRKDLTELATWEPISAFASISDKGVLTTHDLDENKTIVITASFSGKTTTFTVLIKAIQLELTSIAISGPLSIDENSTGLYTCVASYTDGTTKDITSLTTWSLNSDYAYFISNNNLTTLEVSKDRDIKITAYYNNLSAVYTVVIKDVPPEASRTICTNNAVISRAKGYDFSEKLMGSMQGSSDLYYYGSKFVANIVGQLGLVDLGKLNVEQLVDVEIPGSGFNRSGIAAVKDHIYVALPKGSEDGNYIVFKVLAVSDDSVEIEYIYLFKNRLLLEDGDSFDFSDKVKGIASQGDFYFDKQFMANNTGQRGIISLGDIGNVPLDKVSAPAEAEVTQSGVDPALCHTYISLDENPETKFYIVFRVHGLSEKQVLIDYYYKDFTDVKLLNREDDIKVYPNPFSDVITLSAEGADFINSDIRIIDSYGKIIMKQKLDAPLLKIKVPQLVAGFYIVQVKNDRFIVNKKLLKK